MDVDIWAWVGETQQQLSEAGNVGLAMALGDLPHRPTRGDTPSSNRARLSAIAQQAEALELPWLEFYARYWHLLGRVGDRAQGAVAIGDAEHLLSFAQREEVRDCPATPAAVEALARRGPTPTVRGYATERLETLDAVIQDLEPANPAYTGLVTQYVAALIDAGRAGDAVSYAETAVERLRAADREAELGARRRAPAFARRRAW